jgi:hypothetical protein
MNRIGTGKTVIQVISDKYLRSVYCMKEAIRILKYQATVENSTITPGNIPNSEKDNKRIFMIVMNDADVGDGLLAIDGKSLGNQKISTYQEYWLDQCQKILANPQLLINEKYDDYINIYRNINAFIEKINDTKYLKLNYSDIIRHTDTGEVSISDVKKVEFEDFFNKIIRRLTNN